MNMLHTVMNCYTNNEKMQKVTNLLQNLAKNGFFKFAPKHWSSVLFPTLDYFHQCLGCWWKYTTLLTQTHNRSAPGRNPNGLKLFHSKKYVPLGHTQLLGLYIIGLVVEK